MIKYSIDAAIKTGIFNEIMVSTDDAEISAVSSSLGAKVPFMRSSKNSNDNSILADVIKEVLDEYSKNGKTFDYVCCVYPVAPLVDFETIKRSYEILKDNNVDMVIPVISYSHPIQRALEINNDGKLKMINKKFINTRTQDLPKRFYDAGQFFIMNTKSFLKKGRIFMDNTMAIEIPEMLSQDIDNEDDWKSAEIKYKILHNL